MLNGCTFQHCWILWWPKEWIAMGLCYGSALLVTTPLKGSKILGSILSQNICWVQASIVIIAADIVPTATLFKFMCLEIIEMFKLDNSLHSHSNSLLNHKCMHVSAMLDSLMSKEMDSFGVVVWKCKSCDHASKRADAIRKHIEAKHLPSSGFNCQHCGKFCPSRNALQSHVSRQHRNVWNT